MKNIKEVIRGTDDVHLEFTNKNFTGSFGLIRDKFKFNTEVFDLENKNIVGTITSGWDRFGDPDNICDFTFDSATRLFRAFPKPGKESFQYWSNGHRVVVKGTLEVTLPEESGTYYVVLDEFKNAIARRETNVYPLDFYNNAITALIYYNATSGLAFVYHEEHGRDMLPLDHIREHLTIGNRYEDGLEIEGLVNGGTTYTKINAGHTWDEDIRADLDEATAHPFMYRLGTLGEWYQSTPDNDVSFNNGGTYDVWNEFNGSEWVLTEGLSDTDFWIIFQVAINDVRGGSYYNIKILGQHAYPSRGAARDAIRTEIKKLRIDGLASPEFLFIRAWIVRRNGNIIEGDTGELTEELIYY